MAVQLVQLVGCISASLLSAAGRTSYSKARNNQCHRNELAQAHRKVLIYSCVTVLFKVVQGSARQCTVVQGRAW